MTRIVTALAAEARPLVERFALKRASPDGAFPVYSGDGRWLVVSGIGSHRAAAATAYLHAKSGEAGLKVWVNVGIAGHRDRRPGALLIAHSVLHESDERRYYPALIGLPALEAAAVRTVSRPESTFATDSVYDMEAFGFYDQAVRLSTAELVHCVKIVSDNLETGTAKLSRERVTELVSAGLDRVEAVIAALESIGSELASHRLRPTSTEGFVARWRFTVSQRRRLEALLSRHAALGSKPRPEAFPEAKRASEVLSALASGATDKARARLGYS